ncbi:NAD(P)/FAD-dependent oxidoreductase [Cohnella sp. WQ 127256]|uniref:NAD(P)/FAD-dependent oxidoreductase n=1 Tax=Cohnella sp. WQ 127256 TaxID=2938790 RepID=UPI00211913FF|nr:NAD(P)/FAD-dependent oxidoreductase [Cohnella sp. WQ 127256]
MNQSNEPAVNVDVAIIGGGPAGMFAAFYGGLRQMSVSIIESMPQLGGQLAALYPEKYIYDVAGFPKVTAQELVNNLKQQMDHFQPQIYLEEKVTQVSKIDDHIFEIITDKRTHHARSVIITAGVGAFEPRRLELPQAAQYEKSNLHYFVSDLERYRGQKVLISGGGDSALDWALMLEPIAEEVLLIHRRDKFRAHEHSVELLMQSKVKVITPTEITDLQGEDKITHVTLTDVKSGVTSVHEVDSVIINFGFVSSLGPISEWGLHIEGGSIIVDSRMETSIPGIFAAGDITSYAGKLKLIAVGFGEAPTAINNAKVYVDPAAKLSPGHSSNMKL